MVPGILTSVILKSRARNNPWALSGMPPLKKKKTETNKQTEILTHTPFLAILSIFFWVSFFFPYFYGVRTDVTVEFLDLTCIYIFATIIRLFSYCQSILSYIVVRSSYCYLKATVSSNSHRLKRFAVPLN